MKLLTASICSLALVCNVALAGIGGVVYCLEKISGERCVTSTSFLAGDPDARTNCCPFGQPLHPAGDPAPSDCEHCLDLEIEGNDSEAAPALEREVLKTPAATNWIFTDLVPARDQVGLLKKISTRAPPIPCGASRQYAETIRLRV